MKIISTLRTIYRRLINLPWLDKIIYKILDVLTDVYCFLRCWHFPQNYLRRWKLDMLGGSYEPETRELFKKIIRPGMIIVDIGAHIGYFTRLFAALTGKTGTVYAFEADQENFELLAKNTRNFKNIKLCPQAVSDKSGSINFYHSEDKTGCHSVIPADFRQKKITVPAITLDDFIQEKNINKIDLIKMDIEGGELAALEGMRVTVYKNPSLTLLVEFNPGCLKLAGVDPLDFVRRLNDFDFEIFTVGEKQLIKIRPAEIARPEDILGGAEFINFYCARKQPNA